MPDEMASLVRRHGGVPYSAPALQEIYLRDDPDVQNLVSDVCNDGVHTMVLLTGVGTRALVETADSMGLPGRVPGSAGPADGGGP